METTIALLIAKLDPSSILLLLVLAGGWKIAQQFATAFAKHGDAVAASLASMSEDTRALRTDVAEIVKTVAVHDVRIDALERQSEK